MKFINSIYLEFNHLFRHKGILRRIGIFFVRGPLFNFYNLTFCRVLISSIKKLSIDGSKIDNSLNTTKDHINNAVNWICTNQKLQPDDGVPATVSFCFGKIISSGSFPEVTGYIIKTLFDYSKIFNSGDVFESAIKACEFELNFQNEKGWFLIRASNTQNQLTCRAEALNQEDLLEFISLIEKQLKLSGVNFSFNLE